MESPVVSQVDIGECRLRTATWGSGMPEIVMLHDGLGSISQWRSVPEQVAALTGRTVLAYERPGHGASTPIPTGPWPTHWLRDQAGLLAQLLITLGLRDPILVGHSDGGSIALLYAAHQAELGGPTIQAALTIAPHSWVEPVCFEAIVGMRANRGPIEIGLARHHDAPQALFEAWSGVWVSDAFQQWDMRPQLASVEVPVLVAQGALDAYASEDQAHLTAAACAGHGQSVIVPDVGHIMHHDDADVVIKLITDFVQVQTTR